MKEFQLNPECSKTAKRRMEYSIMKASMHPAMQNPYRFSIDTSKQLVVMIVVSVLTVLTWQLYVSDTPYATAPTVGISLK